MVSKVVMQGEKQVSKAIQNLLCMCVSVSVNGGMRGKIVKHFVCLKGKGLVSLYNLDIIQHRQVNSHVF